MRIYINNFNIDLLDLVIKQITEYYIDFETYIQIYGIDGIYQISDKQINKLNCIDKNIEIFENYFEKFTLIVDPSYFEKEVVNNFNPEHISRYTKRCFFKINKNSNIKLVIEGIVLDDTILLNKKNNYNINPTDIYFELSNDIDINDALVKKEIIVFLSLLNNIVI
jgi:hypothetical protein